MGKEGGADAVVGRYVCGVICEPHTWLVGGLARFSSAGVGHALVHRLSVGARAREGNIGNVIDRCDKTPVANFQSTAMPQLCACGLRLSMQRLVYVRETLFFSVAVWMLTRQ